VFFRPTTIAIDDARARAATGIIRFDEDARVVRGRNIRG
jgi:hypothetical protein